MKMSSLINNKNTINNGTRGGRNALCNELSLVDLECISVLINLQAVFLANIMHIILRFRQKQVEVITVQLTRKRGVNHIGISDFLRESTKRNGTANTKTKKKNVQRS